jgi:excisionase family DNA binding protein
MDCLMLALGAACGQFRSTPHEENERKATPGANLTEKPAVGKVDANACSISRLTPGNKEGHWQMGKESEYLTIRQAAKYLSVSEPILRLTIRCGKIPSHRLPGRRQYVVRRDDIIPFLFPLLEGKRAGGTSQAEG